MFYSSDVRSCSYASRKTALFASSLMVMITFRVGMIKDLFILSGFMGYLVSSSAGIIWFLVLVSSCLLCFGNVCYLWLAVSSLIGFLSATVLVVNDPGGLHFASTGTCVVVVSLVWICILRFGGRSILTESASEKLEVDWGLLCVRTFEVVGTALSNLSLPGKRRPSVFCKCTIYLLILILAIRCCSLTVL